jgi:hypothetical protein
MVRNGQVTFDGLMLYMMNGPKRLQNHVLASKTEDQFYKPLQASPRLSIIVNRKELSIFLVL